MHGGGDNPSDAEGGKTVCVNIWKNTHFKMLTIRLVKKTEDSWSPRFVVVGDSPKWDTFSVFLR